MRPFLLYTISTITLFSSCNWVNDDLSDCPSETWLKILYTYNILDVDVTSTQVGDITILAFNKDDKYVDRTGIDSVTLHRGYCMVRVPFPEGTYRLLVWGGTSNHICQLPDLKTGQMEQRSLNISLACDSRGQSNRKLNALFYSNLGNTTISQKYQVITTSLVKDTSYFSCILQDEANAPLSQEDFSFTLESANGIIDYTNTPVGTTPVYYLPYQKEVAVMSGQTSAIHARLNTLRIMKGDQTTLSTKHVPNGQNILRLPLTRYLLLSRIYGNVGEMSSQEYPDHQGSYTLLFFIQPSDTGIPYVCLRMQVNGWIIRLNNSELES